MAKRSARKDHRPRKDSPNKTMTVVAFWIIALLTAFLLLGSIVVPLLWIFVLGAFLSYYTLKK